MENSTYIALSRMDAQQRAMSVVAANMSNASTVGYKRENVLFSDFLSHQHGSKQPEGADTESTRRTARHTGTSSRATCSRPAIP